MKQIIPDSAKRAAIASTSSLVRSFRARRGIAVDPQYQVLMFLEDGTERRTPMEDYEVAYALVNFYRACGVRASVLSKDGMHLRGIGPKFRKVTAAFSQEAREIEIGNMNRQALRDMAQDGEARVQQAYSNLLARKSKDTVRMRQYDETTGKGHTLALRCLDEAVPVEQLREEVKLYLRDASCFYFG